MKILLLEDDIILQEIISEFLEECSYEVVSFYDGEKALDAIGSQTFDLLLLDVNVPSIDGFEILEYLRDVGNTTPVIYLTSLAGVEDLKKGFALGADDYLRKPFELEELHARIEYLAKIYNLADEMNFDGIKFNPKLHTLYYNDEKIVLRQKESAVLEYLTRNPNKIISCEKLIENLWSDDTIPTHATIRTYIKNIRRLFAKDYIENIKGEGYRFNIV